MADNSAAMEAALSNWMGSNRKASSEDGLNAWPERRRDDRFTVWLLFKDVNSSLQVEALHQVTDGSAVE